jgi:isopenicillin-N N-acyltransferase-like protein
VCDEASKYISTLETLCPKYLDELRGVAEGANVDLLGIFALNFRTEITFGLFTLRVKIDGCTSLAVKLANGLRFMARPKFGLAD